MHFIAEIGSTHCNNKDYIKEFIETALEHGADSIKFQLFPDTPEFTSTGNIAITRENFEYAMSLAPGKVSASVFMEDELNYILGLKPPYVKFAFSRRRASDWIQKTIESGSKVIVTSTIWETYQVPVIKLTTAYSFNSAKLEDETVYPNPYMMDFYGLFPGYFQGYSDHSIGWANAYAAVQAGASFIERHMKLDKADIKCPDAVFASSDFSKIQFVKNAKVLT